MVGCHLDWTGAWEGQVCRYREGLFLPQSVPRSLRLALLNTLDETHLRGLRCRWLFLSVPSSLFSSSSNTFQRACPAFNISCCWTPFSPLSLVSLLPLFPTRHLLMTSPRNPGCNPAPVFHVCLPFQYISARKHPIHSMPGT